MQQKFKKDKLKILSALSKAIKKERKRFDKSQRMLAFENDIQKSMISRFENCKNEPRLFSLWRLANALEIKPSQLLSLIEHELKEDIILIDI